MKYIDQDTKVCRSINLVRTTHTECGLDWDDGAILTKNGVVSVYSQAGARSFTILRIVVHGRLWERQFEKHITGRYLVTLANRFALEATTNL